MFSLAGKGAFVTGGASGIGLAVAQRLAAAGARVAVGDLNSAPALAGDGIRCFRLDVRDEPQFHKVLTEAAAGLGGLDILVNNAGVGGATARLDQHPDDDLRMIVDTNLFGVLNGIRQGPKHLRDGASIINTASVAALVDTPLIGIYSMTKAGVVSLTRTAAHELGDRGIRVNAVCPGTVITPMEPADGDEAAIAPLVTALGRTASVADLVGAYHFLAADESRFVTGQILVVDGGWTAGLAQRAWDRLVDAARGPEAGRDATDD